MIGDRNFQANLSIYALHICDQSTTLTSKLNVEDHSSSHFTPL